MSEQPAEAPNAEALNTQSDDGVFKISDRKREQIRQSQVFLQQFFSIIRTGLYHDANNEALAEPSKNFAKVLNWFIKTENGPVTLATSQGLVFVGATRVRINARQANMVHDLEEFMDTRQISGFVFHQHMTPELVRRFATVIVRYRTQPQDENGVAGLTTQLQNEGLGSYITPQAPGKLREEVDDMSDIQLSSEGKSVEHFVKTCTVLSQMLTGESSAARQSLQRMVRNLSDFQGDVSDMIVGLSMISAGLDMSMRSMTILLVSIQIAEQFGASRETIAQLGDVVVELAVYDSKAVKDSARYGYAVAGTTALRSLLGRNDWALDTVRHHLALASRYLPAQESDDGQNLPTASALGQILRIASDYIDLTTPTPMQGSEALLEDSPLPPHEAILLMRDYVGARYTPAIYKGLIRGVGLLPVGTYVEIADGRSAVIVRRTTDPLTFIAQEVGTERQREAAFVRGPNQIERVAVGPELLDIRRNALLGGDMEAFGKMVERIQSK